MAEAVTGDLTPYAPETLEGLDDRERAVLLDQRHHRSSARTAEKRKRESAALDLLVDQFPGEQRAELESLWRELEERQSPEARFVKQIDVLETYLQSREYREAHPTAPMDSFRLEAEEVVTSPPLIRLRGAIARLFGGTSG